MLIGFAPRNHPQQTALRGADDGVDERITPAWLWRELHHRFAFTLDAAASPSNAKCSRYFSLSDCGLAGPWAGERVWCNPPYSDLEGWLAKAWAEFAACCPLVVLLLPANRTEQPWWQRHVELHRDGRGPMRTEFLARRFNFGAPGNPEGKFKTSPPFGCVLAILDRAHTHTGEAA